MAIRGATRDRVLEALRARKPFKNSTGSFRGIDGAVSVAGTWLSDDNKRLYTADLPRYTVLSYDTPIAWVTKSGLVRVPDVKYSLTTTQHQHTARYGLDA